MNSLFITLFIMVANIVAVALLYRSFDRGLDKNKKIFYTMICFGTMYIAVLIVYFLSSLGLSKDTTENAKNMITFTFVPVNVIILLPIIIRSFYKRKDKIISTQQLNTRTITILIVAVILLVGEFFYFRDIQKGIIKIVEQKRNEQSNTAEQNTIERNEENKIENTDIENNNLEDNNIEDNNELSNLQSNTENVVDNNTISE